MNIFKKVNEVSGVFSITDASVQSLPGFDLVGTVNSDDPSDATVQAFIQEKYPQYIDYTPQGVAYGYSARFINAQILLNADTVKPAIE